MLTDLNIILKEESINEKFPVFLGLLFVRFLGFLPADG
jgi:hypothetical protein